MISFEDYSRIFSWRCTGNMFNSFRKFSAFPGWKCWLHPWFSTFSGSAFHPGGGKARRGSISFQVSKENHQDLCHASNTQRNRSDPNAIARSLRELRTVPIKGKRTQRAGFRICSCHGSEWGRRWSLFLAIIASLHRRYVTAAKRKDAIRNRTYEGNWKCSSLPVPLSASAFVCLNFRSTSWTWTEPAAGLEWLLISFYNSNGQCAILTNCIEIMSIYLLQIRTCREYRQLQLLLILFFHYWLCVARAG